MLDRGGGVWRGDNVGFGVRVVGTVMVASKREYAGVRFELRLIEPDREAWYLRIADAQLTTCTTLPLDAQPCDVRAAVILHVARKVELARSN